GLRRLMPKTAVAMWIGGLALVGIPPFAGFFSKDSILAAALGHGWYGVVLWVCGMAGAFLTGLYTFRMIFLVFGGEPSAYVREHPPHVPEEAAPRLSMAWAVGALSILSVVGGWLQFAGVSGTPPALGRGARSLQTGLVRNYVFALAAGLAVLAVVFIAVK